MCEHVNFVNLIRLLEVVLYARLKTRAENENFLIYETNLIPSLRGSSHSSSVHRVGNGFLRRFWAARRPGKAFLNEENELSLTYMSMRHTFDMQEYRGLRPAPGGCVNYV